MNREKLPYLEKALDEAKRLRQAKNVSLSGLWGDCWINFTIRASRRELRKKGKNRGKKER